MGGDAVDIWQHLASRKIMLLKSMKQAVQELEDPYAVFSYAQEIGFSSGLLTQDILDKMVSAHSSANSKQATVEQEITIPVVTTAPTEVIANNSADELGRTIAPIAQHEPFDVRFRNNLPDWSVDDFSENASDAPQDIKVHYDITGKSVTEGKMSDINSCFSDRLEKIRKMIIRNSNLPKPPQEIARLQTEYSRYQGYGNTAVAIGLVNAPRYTKNGHLMWGIEDETGEMTCLLTKRQGDDRDRAQEMILESGLMPDDVLGVSGSFSQTGDIFYVSDLYFPLKPKHQKASSEHGVSVAFISDIHVGSKTFLEAQWHKMVRWFHTDPLAKTIKYLILSGDCVDGVGIYPGQDKELAIPDLYGQYTEFARLLELLPDWVECVMLPGNHDAVRPAEPQPTFEKDIQQDYNSTTFVGNPCDFSLNGVRLLSYHGKSIDDFVAGLRTVTYSDPVEAMRQMLRRRHLAPQWGGKTPLSPEPEDGLVINEVPDIFVTGHVHGHACIDFKGTTLICSSTWQDQTSYQRMLGFQPKPCILTIVNLKSHATTAIPFA
ncbi:MAG: DNA-directed DNA polymerase II small subunit [Candidatus Poseidoniaceae archaeon]|nr:DNA-directed DNA polymerase II small subunit [Candidatus Poseidoniaceae archaeon]